MIKFNSIAAAAVCLAVLAPAAASAQIKKSGNGYLLRLKFKPGQIHKYTLSTVITGLTAAQGAGANGAINLTGTLQQKVISVSGKKAKVELATSAMQMAGGQSFGEPQTTTIDVDEFGNGSNANGKAGYGVHFPKDPVKVGGTWSQTMVLPGSMGATNTGTSTYKFNGIKKVGKKQLADVSFSIASTGMMKGGSGRALLQPVDGSLVSMSMKLTVSNPGGGPDLNTTVTISAAK